MENDTAPLELHGDKREEQKHRKTSFMILTSQVGERFYIGDDIRVAVRLVEGNQVAFGFEAPRSIQIDRQEKAWRRKRAVQAQAAGAATITYRLSYLARGGSYVCGGKHYPTRIAVRSAALACAAERTERGLNAFDSYTAFREVNGIRVTVAVYALADDSLLLQKGRGYSRMWSGD